MGLPATSRCRKQDTSSRVMVISPTGRWKENVSWCHLSIRAFIKPLFAARYYVMIRSANPDRYT